MSINLDKTYIYQCSIEVETVLETVTPLTVPDELHDLIVSDEYGYGLADDSIISWLESMNDCKFYKVTQYNTCNHQNDLDTDIMYTVYSPSEDEWYYDGRTVVAIELSSGGDPRYAYYNYKGLYQMNDAIEQLLINNQLSYQVMPFIKGEPDWNNSECLDSMPNVYADPIWNEKNQGYVFNSPEYNRPMIIFPTC